MGAIIEALGQRKAEMADMVTTGNGQIRMVFSVPARGLIGFSTEFLSMTRGYGIMNHSFDNISSIILSFHKYQDKDHSCGSQQHTGNICYTETDFHRTGLFFRTVNPPDYCCHKNFF